MSLMRQTSVSNDKVAAKMTETCRDGGVSQGDGKSLGGEGVEKRRCWVVGKVDLGGRSLVRT